MDENRRRQQAYVVLVDVTAAHNDKQRIKHTAVCKGRNRQGCNSSSIAHVGYVHIVRTADRFRTASNNYFVLLLRISTACLWGLVGYIARPTGLLTIVN